MLKASLNNKQQNALPEFRIELHQLLDTNSVRNMEILVGF
jgi:hypothetical protein